MMQKYADEFAAESAKLGGRQGRASAWCCCWKPLCAMLWALVRRSELAVPIADAAMHAVMSVVITMALTWWALRY